jgi:cytochrome P450
MNFVDRDTVRELGSRFDPLSADYLLDPYPLLSEAREIAPAFYCDAIRHWVVTRHADIKTIFRNPPTFSAQNANSPLSAVCPMAARALEEGGWKAIPTLANVDPPQHTRVRKLANTAFAPRRVAEMEPFIRRLVEKFCEQRFRGGTADLIRELAWDLPALVLFKILGVPDEDVERIKTGSWNRILFVYGRPNDDDQVRAAQGMAAFWRYAEELVASRLRQPQNDFTSALAHAVDPDGVGLTPQQTTTVILNLLFAGHETTTGLLGNAFRRLLADRQAWQEIVDDPGLIPNAAEEILRLDSSVIAWRRHTTTDVEVGGVKIPAHANLLLMLGSGNRDPAVFANPDRLDIRRPNARENLSFGVGAHLCLGAPLARMQAVIAIEILSQRLRNLRLAGNEPLRFAPNVSFRGPLELHVEWDA